MKTKLLMFAAALLPALILSQEVDPTRLSESVGSVLKAQLAEFRALEIKGLVSASGAGGVAVVAAKGDGVLRVARKGATLPLSASGVPFPVRVVDVTHNGVEVAAETLDAKWTIPVSFAGGEAAGARPARATNALAHVEFEGIALKTALRLLADQAQENFVWTDRSADVPVSLFLRDAPVEKVVDELCKSHRLWYRRDAAGGVTRIVTMEEFKESLTGYQQEEIIETFTLLYPNVTEVASIIQGIYADRVRLTLGDEDILDDELSDLGRRFEKFQTISDGGGSSDLMGGFSAATAGGRTGAYSGRRGGGAYSGRGGAWINGGVQRQAAEERREAERIERFGSDEAAAVTGLLAAGASNATVAAALADAKFQPPSVYVTVARRSNMLVVRTGDPRIMEEIRKLIAKVDVPTPTVYLEVEIMQLELDDGISSAFEWNLAGAWNDKHFGVELDGATAFAPNPPGAITFNLVSKHVESRIKAERTRGKLKTLATPSLLTAHNEVSQFFVGEEIPIVRNVTATLIPGDQNNKTIVVPNTEIEWRKVGTRILITPNINVDRTVTLRLMQETSEKVKDGGSILVSASGADAGGATQTAVQKFDVDTVKARSIAGAFVAQNEMAVLAGGMITEEETSQVSGIPLLMDVPYLGWFFRSTEKVKKRSELVIYLKPHVLSVPGEARAVAERVNADKVKNPFADRYRSAADAERQRRDRAAAEKEQAKPKLLPDVDPFHVK